MANFDLGLSALAWERSCDRRSLAARDPSTPERRTRKQFLPIAYCMANLLGLSAVVGGFNGPELKFIPDRTRRKVISPIAYFMANYVADL
jgi:hypothetical protein